MQEVVGDKYMYLTCYVQLFVIKEVINQQMNYAAGKATNDQEKDRMGDHSTQIYMAGEQQVTEEEASCCSLPYRP